MATFLRSSLSRSARCCAMRRVVASAVYSSTSPKQAPTRVLFKALSTQAQKATPPSVLTQVDPKHRLMDGYMEYLDTMLAKAEKIETSVSELQNTYAQKQQLKPTIKWMDPDEIDRLFETAGKQKQEMKKDIGELKKMVRDAKRIFAVDAPDGESDWYTQKELDEIHRIIQDAAATEDKEAVERMHQMQEAEQQEARKIFAVDAPDGETDGHIREELEEIKIVIDDAAEHEDREAIERLHKEQQDAQKIFAVDAPDGETDGQLQEEMVKIQKM